MGEAMNVWGQGVYAKSLYCPFNFAVWGTPGPWCGGPGGGTRGPRSPGAYRAWVGGLVLGQLQVCTPGLAPGVRGGLKEATATPCPATKGAASLGPNFCPGGGLVAGQVSCPVPPGSRNQLRSAPRWGWSPSRTLFLSGGPSRGAPPPRPTIISMGTGRAEVGESDDDALCLLPHPGSWLPWSSHVSETTSGPSSRTRGGVGSCPGALPLPAVI